MTTTPPTLNRPATYHITVPGHLDESWADWVEGFDRSSADGAAAPVTTLTVTVDQAGLQGLLRRLCALGKPLIAFNRVAPGPPAT